MSSNVVQDNIGKNESVMTDGDQGRKGVRVIVFDSCDREFHPPIKAFNIKYSAKLKIPTLRVLITPEEDRVSLLIDPDAVTHTRYIVYKYTEGGNTEWDYAVTSPVPHGIPPNITYYNLEKNVHQHLKVCKVVGDRRSLFSECVKILIPE